MRDRDCGCGGGGGHHHPMASFSSAHAGPTFGGTVTVLSGEVTSGGVHGAFSADRDRLTFPDQLSALTWIANFLNGWAGAGCPVTPRGGGRFAFGPSEEARTMGNIFPCVNLVDGTYPGGNFPIYNRCDQCRTAVMSWSNGQLTRHNVPPHSQIWVASVAPSGRQVDDTPCARLVEESEIKFRGEPPEEVKELLRFMFSGRPHDAAVQANEVPAVARKLLDAFASKLAGRDCPVRAIYGCGSCCNAPNSRSNLVNTDCGWQCWNCYGTCDEIAGATAAERTAEGSIVNVEGHWYVRKGRGFVEGEPPHALGCEGNACGAVSITWNGAGYTISNSSGNRVRVTMRWMFGWSCMGPSDIHLGPYQSVNYGNGGYCHPWQANFE